MNIAVIGLGKLGLPTALCFAREHTVVGYDSDRSWRSRVNSWLLNSNGVCPLPEPGLERTTRFTVADSVAQATVSAEVVFIVVPTPSTHNGRSFSNEYVLAAITELGPTLQPAAVVVLVSTVAPGSCDEVLAPALEKAAGRPVPLIYNPEFIALGSVVDNFLYPDLLLVGVNAVGSVYDEAPPALKKFYAAYNGVLWSGTWKPERVRVMRYINAELAKLMLNVAVTRKIDYANEMAGIAGQFDGTDIDEILDTVSCDDRIGGAYLKAGAPFGGPCFPRDVRVLQALGYGEEKHVLWLDWLRRCLAVAPEGVHQVVGVSYKPGTPVTEESPSFDVQEWIDREDCWCSPAFVSTKTAVVVFMHDVDQSWADIEANLVQGAVVIDPWRRAKNYKWRKDIRYCGYGLGSKEQGK